jgi:hypothetical protein
MMELIIGPRLIGNNYPKSLSKFGETAKMTCVNDGKSWPTTVEAWLNMDNNSTENFFSSSEGLSGLVEEHSNQDEEVDFDSKNTTDLFLIMSMCGYSYT